MNKTWITRRRKYGPSGHSGKYQKNDAEYCGWCGAPHDFDTSIDNDTWNRVIRGSDLPDMLCLGCIMFAFQAAGEPFTAKVYGDGLPGITIEFTPVATDDRE